MSPQAGPGAAAGLYVQAVCGKREQRARGGVAEEAVCAAGEAQLMEALSEKKREKRAF